MSNSPDVFGYLVSGIFLGLSAGVSPGPLLTLVIAETLTHGIKAGIKVAVAPLITDGPIIAVSILLLSQLTNTNILLGAISIFGALFVGYLGIESIRTKEVRIDFKKVKPKSLQKGALTNALSPHPYVFWFSVGGPLMVQGLEVSTAAPIVFIAGFLGLLVISKIVIALVTEKSRQFLQSNTYIYLVRALGVALLIFALILLKDGFELLNII